jgi:hypothetical protein
MQRMGWTYAELMETPERVVDDVLLVMQAESQDAEEHAREMEREKERLGRNR